MYRYVAPSEQPLLKHIASLIEREHPREFEILGDHVRPHVSILSWQRAATTFGLKNIPNPRARATEFLRQQKAHLPYTKSTLTFGRCTTVDLLGSQISVFVESQVASSEINLSCDALGKVVGMRVGRDRRPHVSLGAIIHPENPDLRAAILETAVGYCGALLPRNLFLEPVSLHGPASSFRH